MQVTREDMQFVAQLVDQLCGVMLDESKGYLVESRLGQLARDQGCASYRELCQRARANSDRALQQKIIDIIGIDPQEAQKRFGFLLRAFEYGAPPHAGVAYGIDRLVTIITGNESIRDCIAFPKTQKGTCLMTEAPSDVDAKQLKDLGLVVLKK